MEASTTTITSPLPSASVGRLCPQCQDWLIGPRDSYCSACGRLQLPVAMVPERVPLNLMQDRSRMLVFSNDGPKPVTFEVLPRGSEVPWIQFEAPRERTLEPGKKSSMKVWLEEKDFPKGLTVERLVYQCRIDKKPHQALEFVVEVTGPPLPELKPAFLDFGQVVAGQSVRRELEITNRGGTMLVLQKLEVADAPELQVDQTVKFPVPIDIDRRFTVPVSWNPAEDDESSEVPPAREGEVKLTFGHSPTPLVVRARATKERQLVSVEPREIRIEQALPKYDEARTFRLENKGTVALTLKAPKPAVPWIEIEAPAPVFRLDSPHSSAEPQAKDSLPTLGTSCEISVHLSPRKAGGPGHYQSEIHFAVVGNGSLPLLSVPITLNVLTPRPYRGSVGIDFGTTNSVVALQDLDTGEVTLVADRSLGDEMILALDAHLIPSVLVLASAQNNPHKQPQYSIGRRGQREAQVSENRTVRAVKRLVGFGTEIRLSNQLFNPEEIAGLIVRRLVEYAERHLLSKYGKAFELTEAAVTVPSAFFDSQIKAIEAACHSAGISTAQPSATNTSQGSFGGAVLYEPVAAALFALHQIPDPELASRVQRAKGLNMLIYDHGGGTLDLAVVRVTASRGNRANWSVKVLSTVGSSAVGGDTFDQVVASSLLDGLKLRDHLRWIDPELITLTHSKILARANHQRWRAEDRQFILKVREEWRLLSEKAKIALSKSNGDLPRELPSDEVSVEVRLPSGILIGFDIHGRLLRSEEPQSYTLTRKDCDAKLRAQFGICEMLTRRCIQIACLKPEQVDYIIHAGRQSLMPEIRRRILEVFPPAARPNDKYLDESSLKVCVAKGAALFGRVRNSGSGGISLANEGRVLPFSYGRRIKSGMSEKFEMLVPVGTPYPTLKPIIRKIPAEQAVDSVIRLDLWQSSGEGTSIPSPGVRHLSTVELRVPDAREGLIKLNLEVDARRQLVISTEVDRVEVQAEELEEDLDEWIG